MLNADGFIEEHLNNWRMITPDKSNYVDMHKYCEIQDVISIAVARALLLENDNINNNHTLYTHILQQPVCTGVSGFFRWLNKKVFGAERLEMLRIVYDDTYYIVFPMYVLIGLSKLELSDFITPSIQRMIKKSKEIKE